MLADLIERHRLTPGRLVHVGQVGADTIPGYYDAGFIDITVFYADREHIKQVRTRFPGVNAVDNLVDTALPAQTYVIDVPGHELALVQLIPAEVELLIVRTAVDDNSTGPSSYDLLTEAATTRGFVEVGQWGGGADLGVAYLKT